MTTATLLEYSVIMATNRIDPTLGPQLMAEIGNVICFTHLGALTAFVGVNPRKNNPGNTIKKVCVRQRKPPSAYAIPPFRSWMDLSSILLLMMLSIPSWTISGYKVSLTTST